ncbi:MAG: 3-dehydroquinate synthase [Chthoniobacterales bacterium]
MNSIRVTAGDKNYEVFVGNRLLAETGTFVAKELKGPGCAVISDENVAPRFAPVILESLTRSGFRPVLLTVPAGEQSKTMAQAEDLCGRLAQAGLDRTSFVVALGGGMIGDLAGFVAAIYHRRIPCVQVPTSLLAQVDSSIGGKTAVNTTAAKNLIGAWHQPALVIADVDTLATLPPRELRQGFAEIVKHAVIRDRVLFDGIERFKDSDLPAIIRRNVEIKAAVVAADERETTGERALLNFGHTIGHAIERAGDYGQLLHGEAVSLGIVAATEISVRRAGLSEEERERIISALRRFGLPTQLPPGFPKEKILDVVRFDKKFTRGNVRFVVIPRIGTAQVAADVTMADIEAAIAAL